MGNEKRSAPCFELLTAQLGDRVVSFALRSEDLTGLPSVRFYTGQNRLVSAYVYIAPQQQLLEKEDLFVYKGAAVIACDASDARLESDPRFREATVLEVSASCAAVFNILSRILSAGEYQPPMETRGGLAWTWDQILSSKLLADRDIRDALANSGVRTGTFFRVITVLPGENTQERQLLRLGQQLERHIPGAVFISRRKMLMALTFSDERIPKPLWQEEQVEKALRESGAMLMSGHQSRDYAMVRTLTQICRRCLELAAKLDPGSGPVYDINRYSMYYAIDMCAQSSARMFGHMDVLLLVHPAVVAVRRYDVSRGTDLLQVLEQYLRCSGSVQKTAQALYVHRNTVNQKLTRLRALLPLDLEDGSSRQLLLFSCQALRYYENILNGHIRP